MDATELRSWGLFVVERDWGLRAPAQAHYDERPVVLVRRSTGVYQTSDWLRRRLRLQAYKILAKPEAEKEIATRRRLRSKVFVQSQMSIAALLPSRTEQRAMREKREATRMEILLDNGLIE